MLDVQTADGIICFEKKTSVAGFCERASLVFTPMTARCLTRPIAAMTAGLN